MIKYPQTRLLVLLPTRLLILLPRKLLILLPNELLVLLPIGLLVLFEGIRMTIDNGLAVIGYWLLKPTANS